MLRWLSGSEMYIKHKFHEKTRQFIQVYPLNERASKFKDYIIASRSIATANTYIAAVRKFENFLESKKILLKNAQEGLLEDFVSWLLEQKLNPASIRVTYAAIKTYTDWCRTHEDGGCPIFARPRMPHLEEKMPFVLTTDQLVLYLSEASKIAEPSRTALLLLPYCGLRVSELCKLRAVDIITETDETGERWTVLTVVGKGRKFRHMPIAHKAKPILLSYIRNWRIKHRDSKWLFPSKSKGKDDKKAHLSAKTLQLHLRNIRERAKLPEELTPHALRRTCFTYLYRSGVPIETIAKIAGHSSVDTTMKHYIAVSTREVLKTLNKAERKHNG